MNRFKLSLLACISMSVLVLESGCGTVTPSPSASNSPPLIGTDTNGMLYVSGHLVNPSDVETGLRLASAGGARAAIQYDQNSREYLELADTILTTALNDKQFDPEQLASALSNLSVKEAHDPKVIEGVNSAIAMYQTFFGTVAASKISNASPYLVPALTGLRDGIHGVLNGSP